MLWKMEPHPNVIIKMYKLYNKTVDEAVIRYTYYILLIYLHISFYIPR